MTSPSTVNPENRHQRVAVVAGASRGIGRAIALQLVAEGWLVAAGCRNLDAADGLHEALARNGGFAPSLDVTNADSVARAADEVERRFGAVDALIVCAGANADPDRSPERSKGPLPELEDEAVTAVLRSNAIGTALAVQRFMPLLASAPRSGAIMCLSSIRGSLELTDGPGSIAYAMGKAALNMFVRKVALWPGRGATSIFAVHPGWVATDMGGPEAPVAAPEAAESLIALLGNAAELNGRFVGADGADMPW